MENVFCEDFIKPSGIHESLFIGYLWKTPSLYKKYKNHSVTQFNKDTNEGTLTIKMWYFFYKLGEIMYDSGIRDFSDTAVYSFVSSQPDIDDFSWIKRYNKYGGFQTIYQIMQECTSDNSNDSYHFSEIQKYELLRYYDNNGMINPEKTLVKKGKKILLKTFLSELTTEKIKSYINYMNKKGTMSVGSNNMKLTNLTDGLDDSVANFNKGTAMGLPLYGAPRLTNAIKGWQKGNFVYLVLSSGVGKSSFTYSKFALSILDSNEKCVFGVNEENKNRAHHTLLSTVSAAITNDPISRERLSQGYFTPEEFAKINKAKKWLESHDANKIKFGEIEKFLIDDYIETIEMYKSLGYNYAILDTLKPDSSKQDIARWEKFSQHSQDLFDCIKPSANNIGMLATLQLKIGMDTRYLDLDAIGKARETVEVADVVLMGRLLFEDEYDGKRLKVYDYEESGNGYHRKEILLDESKEYMILFIPKNRNGAKTQQIVYEIDYDTNDWKEIGFASLRKSAK